MLDGLYRKGLEKVSYLSLTYDWKNWRFGAQCLFPFQDDKFSNETAAIQTVECDRDYYLNLVLQYRYDDTTELKRFRIDLSRDGIRSIEEVGASER